MIRVLTNQLIYLRYYDSSPNLPFTPPIPSTDHPPFPANPIPCQVTHSHNWTGVTSTPSPCRIYGPAYTSYKTTYCQHSQPSLAPNVDIHTSRALISRYTLYLHALLNEPRRSTITQSSAYITASRTWHLIFYPSTSLQPRPLPSFHSH